MPARSLDVYNVFDMQAEATRLGELRHENLKVGRQRWIITPFHSFAAGLVLHLVCIQSSH